MKTTKTISKVQKVPARKIKSQILNSASNWAEPGEDQIRQKAEDIYNQRMENGKHGTDLSDWLEAESYLQDSIL